MHYAPLSAMLDPLHSITNQELFEKHLCNQSNHYENMDTFRYKGKPSCATAKSTEWDTKEDTGKSMKNTLYVLWYAKRHLSGQSDKPVALADIELHLSKGISQLLNQSVS